MADPVEMTVIQHAQVLPEARRGEFQMSYMSQRKDRTTALLLSLFLGFLGVDRFYLGQTLLGVVKLLTGGMCGVWALIDWFLIMGATDTYNRGVVQKLAMIYPPR